MRDKPAEHSSRPFTTPPQCRLSSEELVELIRGDWQLPRSKGTARLVTQHILAEVGVCGFTEKNRLGLSIQETTASTSIHFVLPPSESTRETELLGYWDQLVLGV